MSDEKSESARNLQQVAISSPNKIMKLGQNSNCIKEVSSSVDNCDAEHKICKARRKSFAVEQLVALEFQYAQCRYLRGLCRRQLARRLNLTETQVKIW